jgi:SLT domain-containing protein
MTDQLQPVRCRAVFSDELPMTTKSISEAIARGLYGRSDKPNARENQSAEWQAGYKHGLTAQDGGESIEAEFERRGCIMSDGFREWKRGMWAAIMQRSELAAENTDSQTKV